MTIKECVQGRVNFSHYQDGNLVYICENGFEFPIPTSDCGSARFLANDKGMLFMRWIGKHLKTIEEGKLND